MTTPFRPRTTVPDLNTPLPTPRSTISDWYQQYLGRTPDAGGWEYWTNAAYNGTPLSEIQAAIQKSPEANQRTVTKLYNQYLGRNPETEGLNFWTNALQQGTPYDDLLWNIQNSQEGKAYAAANPVIPGWGPNLGPTDAPLTDSYPRLDVVYNADGTVYNPLQDKNGVYNADGSYSYRHDPNKWTPIEPEDWLTGGGQTPPDLVTPFPGPSGVVGQPIDGTQGLLGTQGQLSGQPSDYGIGGSQYGALLNNMYNQYLGRNAEAEGANYWSNQLAGGASEESIRNAIANSPEAQQYAATQAGLSALG